MTTSVSVYFDPPLIGALGDNVAGYTQSFPIKASFRIDNGIGNSNVEYLIEPDDSKHIRVTVKKIKEPEISLPTTEADFFKMNGWTAE
jgi:hypothetical protein